MSVQQSEPADDLAVATDRPVEFNEADCRPYEKTKELYFGLGEVFMGSFSVEGYNATSIDIRLIDISGGRQYLYIGDNGNAHEDSFDGCYKNARSLISYRKSSNRTSQGPGSGYSRNGTGAGRSLCRLGPDVLNLIGSYILVRHGLNIEKRAAAMQDGNATAHLATFDLQDYLSGHYRNLKAFLEWMEMKCKAYKTACALNLLKFIPLTETVPPQPNRQKMMNCYLEKKKIIPLDTLPEEQGLKRLATLHAAIKAVTNANASESTGSNTGFSTCIITPHGTWHSEPVADSSTGTREVIHDILYSTKQNEQNEQPTASMHQTLAAGFLQPAWNVDDLIKNMPRSLDEARSFLRGMLKKQDEAGFNITATINGGDPFRVGYRLQALLESCCPENSENSKDGLLFFHRTQKSNSVVIGMRPPSVKAIADALPCDLLCDSDAHTGVPLESIRNGKVSDRANNCFLVFHIVHNKVMRVSCHRNPARYNQGHGLPLDVLRTFLRACRDKPRLPFIFQGTPSEDDQERLKLLAKSDYLALAEEACFETKHRPPMVLFNFVKHELLDSFKTHFNNFEEDVVKEILPEALRSYFCSRIDDKTAELEEKALANPPALLPVPAPSPASPASALNHGVATAHLPELASTSSVLPAVLAERRSSRPIRVAAETAKISVATPAKRYAPSAIDATSKKPRPHSKGTDLSAVFSNFSVKKKVINVHHSFSSLSKHVKPPKKCNLTDRQQSLLAKWVCVQFDHKHHQNAKQHWVGVVVDVVAVRAGKQGDWCWVLFSGLFHDGCGRPGYDDSESMKREKLDLSESLGEVAILKSDPLRDPKKKKNSN